MDWPEVRLIHPRTKLSASFAGFPGAKPASSAAVWPAANRAILCPVRIVHPFLVTRALICNGTTVSGNLDVGIYTLTGTRILSTGSTAMANPVGGQLQEIDITDVLMSPGAYYFAMAVDNVTGNFIRSNSPTLDTMQMMGLAQMASAFPLPATITPAALATAYFPHFGFAWGDV